MIKFLYIVPIIVVFVFGYLLLRGRKKYLVRRASQKKDFLNIFTNDNFSIPSLQFGSSYAWDTFEISFKSNEDFFKAQQLGLFDEFKSKIKSYYKPDFDPDMAISFVVNRQEKY